MNLSKTTLASLAVGLILFVAATLNISKRCRGPEPKDDNGILPTIRKLMENQAEQCEQRMQVERETCNVLLKAHRTQFETMRRKCREAADLATDPDRLTDTINDRLEQLRLRRRGGEPSGEP